MSSAAFPSLLAKVCAGGFVVGAGMELFMVKVRIGKETFYDVAKRKKLERQLEAEEAERQYWEERERKAAGRT